MQKPWSYDAMTLRNSGYIDAEVQARVRGTRLLMAGCGLGSVVAEAALRTGFEQFTLIDGDTVAAHNLNRQAFVAQDLGTPKVEALARRLGAIHPQAGVRTHARYLSAADADELVAGADLVVDTIDFLDLPAIVALHDAAARRGIPVFSAFSCGWGALAGCFAPGGVSLRELFGLPREDAAKASMVAAFQQSFARLAAQLPPEFVAVTHRSLAGMSDGTPCPAPQLAVGAWSAAALLVTQMTRWVAGEPVPLAPELLLLDVAGLAGAARASIKVVVPPVLSAQVAAA